MPSVDNLMGIKNSRIRGEAEVIFRAARPLESSVMLIVNGREEWEVNLYRVGEY